MKLCPKCKTRDKVPGRAYCKQCEAEYRHEFRRRPAQVAKKAQRLLGEGEIAVPKRLFGANSIWDADRWFREKFMVIYKQAAREAQKRGPNACYLWTLKLNKQGYGEWRWYDRKTTKQYGSGAHRISLELKLGRPLAEGMLSGHCCPVENRPDGVHPDRRCFRQEHLEEITLSQNVADWWAARRAVLGDLNEIEGEMTDWDDGTDRDA